MDTPDVTKNQMVGLGTIVTVLASGVSAGGDLAIASVIGATVIAVALLVSDTIIRGNRAKYIP